MTTTLQSALGLLAQLLPLTLLGLIIGQLAGRSRWFRKLGGFTAGLARLAHLPPRASPALALFLFNPEAALAALTTESLNDREAEVAYLVSGLPMSLHYVIVYLGPIAVPTLGPTGLAFITLYVLVYGGVATAGVLLGRYWLSPSGEGTSIAPEPSETLRESLMVALQQFIRVALVLVPGVLFMYAIIETEFIASQIGFLPGLLGLPPEALIILLTGVASTVGAIGTTAPLLQQGMLGPVQALAALLIALALHNLVGYLHYDLPLTGSLFGPRRGTRMATTFKVVQETITLTIAAVLLLA